MALTLPKSYTVSVTTVDAQGQRHNIELDTVLAEIAPYLSTPTIIELIANTSAVDTSKFADIDYRAIAKSEPTVSYVDGKLVKNPEELEYKTLEINPVRLRPVEIVDKYKLNGIDISADDGSYKDGLARQVINFSDAIRIDNEVLALNNLAFSAQKTQTAIKAAHNEATTFKKGAHVEIKNLTTADDVYNSLSQAKTVIKKIGKPNAATAYDANFKYARGINLTDVVCLIDEEKLDLLLSKSGVFASESGNELFKTARIKNVLGIDVIPTSNLPEGVNWIMVTTGKMGALGYTKIGIGDWFQFDGDPKWQRNQRLHCAREQVLGVIYEQLILASFEEGTNIEFMNKYGNSTASTRIENNGSETFSEEDKEKGLFRSSVENIKQKIIKEQSSEKKDNKK